MCNLYYACYVLYIIYCFNRLLQRFVHLFTPKSGKKKILFYISNIWFTELIIFLLDAQQSLKFKVHFRLKIAHRVTDWIVNVEVYSDGSQTH